MAKVQPRQGKLKYCKWPFLSLFACLLPFPFIFPFPPAVFFPFPALPQKFSPKVMKVVEHGRWVSEEGSPAWGGRTQIRQRRPLGESWAS